MPEATQRVPSTYCPSASPASDPPLFPCAGKTRSSVGGRRGRGCLSSQERHPPPPRAPQAARRAMGGTAPALESKRNPVNAPISPSDPSSPCLPPSPCFGRAQNFLPRVLKAKLSRQPRLPPAQIRFYPIAQEEARPTAGQTRGRPWKTPLVAALSCSTAVSL